MEVKLDKRYPLDVSVEQAWAVLSDVRATAACMPGAAITEQIDATHYKGTVKTKVGPASMAFGGDIEVLGLDEAARSLQMLGKGADRSGSAASMNLSAHLEAGETPGSSVLVGQATVTVSGKLAQFGSRLLVPVSDAMLAQFANNFRVAAAAVPLPESAAPVAAEATAAADASAPMVSAAPSIAAGAAAPLPSPAARAPAPVAAAPANELNALSLIWTVIKGWFAGLFGKRT